MSMRLCFSLSVFCVFQVPYRAIRSLHNRTVMRRTLHNPMQHTLDNPQRMQPILHQDHTHQVGTLHQDHTHQVGCCHQNHTIKLDTLHQDHTHQVGTLH